jgi:tetratricopeptide (TPR) repeat protein
MTVQVGFVGVLMFSIGLGSVLAQEQPVRKHGTASTPGVPAVAPRAANPDAQAIGGLLDRFIRAYNVKDAKASTTDRASARTSIDLLTAVPGFAYPHTTTGGARTPVITRDGPTVTGTATTTTTTGGGWGSFALGAATGVTAWALGSSYYNWGYASYANPYYAEEAVAQPIVIEQTVAGGEPQTVTVPAYMYDYTQPIDTQSAPPPGDVANPAVAKFDLARAAFGTGDYAGALKLTDGALKVLPSDATLHEFRALVLFAVGKYDLAAGPLYAVLSVGPGWDWTTMAGLYPNIDVYTSQLRKLEGFVSANPKSASGRFVLAYHYLTQGHTDAALSRLKEVVALAPQDTLSAQLVKQFSPPSESPGTPAPPTAPEPAAGPAKTGNLAGNWTAQPAGDAKIDLRIGGDETFTWKVTAKGKPRELAGKWSLTNNLLTLAQDGDAGALVGHVSWQGVDKWNFRVIGTGAEDQGLLFTH